jgi:uncharacterized membrane protein YbjE (DUF340 family)
VLVIVLCFLVGIALGRLLRGRQGVVRLADRFTMGSVYVLLFVLGLSVGTNHEVLSHIGTLGVQAAVLTVGAIAGSVLAVQLLNLWPTGTSHED